MTERSRGSEYYLNMSYDVGSLCFRLGVLFFFTNYTWKGFVYHNCWSRTFKVKIFYCQIQGLSSVSWNQCILNKHVLTSNNQFITKKIRIVNVFIKKVNNSNDVSELGNQKRKFEKFLIYFLPSVSCTQCTIVFIVLSQPVSIKGLWPYSSLFDTLSFCNRSVKHFVILKVYINFSLFRRVRFMGKGSDSVVYLFTSHPFQVGIIIFFFFKLKQKIYRLY